MLEMFLPDQKSPKLFAKLLVPDTGKSLVDMVGTLDIEFWSQLDRELRRADKVFGSCNDNLLLPSQIIKENRIANNL